VDFIAPVSTIHAFQQARHGVSVMKQFRPKGELIGDIHLEFGWPVNRTSGGK
jgi:hypothetical protein